MKTFIYNLGIRLTGLLIFLLCLLGLVTTTLLSISGSIKDFNNLTLPELALIFTISFSALTIFVASCFLTRIKTHYYSHYNKIVILRTGLLVVMIYNNFHFFLKVMIDSSLSDKIIYFILCFLVDFSTMTLLPFAFDRMLLNYTVKKQVTRKLTDNILKMFLFNLTFKPFSKIKKEYEENLKLLNSVKDKETIKVMEEKPDIKLIEEKASNSVKDKETEEQSENTEDEKVKNVSDFVQDKDIRLLKDVITNFKDENICPPVRALVDLTGLKKQQILDIKKILEKRGFIKTDGNITYVMEG